MAQLGWHPMHPFTAPKQKPWLAYFQAFAWVCLLGVITAVIIVTYGFWSLQPNQASTQKIALTATANASFAELQPPWPNASLPLKLAPPQWRLVTPASAPNNSTETLDLPVAVDLIEQAKVAMQSQNFQRVLNLLAGDSSRAALMLRAAALQQLNQHQQVIDLLANKALNSDLHLRAAISSEAIAKPSAALFHYQAFLTANNTPSSLRQYAQRRIAALGGQQ